MELEYENRTMEFTVKPTDALVIDVLSKGKKKKIIISNKKRKNIKTLNS